MFGWSVVGHGGYVTIPPHAIQEYGYHEGEKLVVISGSKTSGGFSIARIPAISGSKSHQAMIQIPGLMEETEVGGIFEMKGRLVSSGRMSADGRFLLGNELILALDIREGDRLLLVRGSGLGIGLVSGGPIFELAKEHPELITFE